jgi:nitrogen regulatory protein PII 1
MKMIRAIIRPDSADEVSDGLADAGFVSMTKENVFGRGKEKGLTLGAAHYDELPKTMIMVVVEDAQVKDALKIIQYKAYTGNIGDGKIFISSVEDTVTVRTGSHDL